MYTESKLKNNITEVGIWLNIFLTEFKVFLWVLSLVVPIGGAYPSKITQNSSKDNNIINIII